MIKIFLSIIILLILNFKAYASKLNVYYSGFSFSNNYESNVEYSKYSSILIKDKISNSSIDLISSTLIKSLKSSKFKKINLIYDELIDLNNLDKGSVVMSVALQHEEFSQEYNYGSKVYNGFFDSYFQILFYDFSTKNLIASIPFDFEISMLSEKKFTEDEILKRIKNFYMENMPFERIQNIINNFDLKRKYNLRIGVTKIEINNRAFNHMPANSKNHKNAMKNLIAQTFSKRFSYANNVAMVPYAEGQAIGNAMKLKFIQSDEIYSINLPSPDFHVHLKLKGFKKVLARSSAAEDLYLYGSFFDIKIYQPEINKIYFNESLRGVTQVKIPKKQSKVYDWRKYYYNMETFFNNFSKSIEKPNKKWLKETTKKNIKKDLKSLNKILDKLK